MTKVHDLNKLGQSVWYDNIRRALLDSGGLQALIDKGVTGVTSNPSIFEKAIAGSNDYDEDLHRLVDEGKSVEEIFEALALDDIRRTTRRSGVMIRGVWHPQAELERQLADIAAAYAQ